MKIGPERKPLSERLQETLLSTADPVADSTRSASKTYASDCTAALTRAQATIESDILFFATASRRHLSEALNATEADLKRLELMVKPFTLTISAIFLMILLISFTASWFWAGLMIDKAQSASLWQLGLRINQTPTGSVLSWDPNQVELITCQSGKTSHPCLRLIDRN